MNQTHVTLVKTKAVTLHDYKASSAYCQTSAATSLEKHTTRRTRRFAEFTRLNATASSIISLTADIIIPPAPRVNVLQHLFAHGDLCAKPSHGTTRNEATNWFLAWCLTHSDVKRFLVVDEGAYNHRTRSTRIIENNNCSKCGQNIRRHTATFIKNRYS